jgi:hemerythrin-like domain-containing protein
MGTESMSARDFGAWMQDEHTTMSVMAKVLREHIAAMPESGLGDWLHGLQVAFGRLQKHLGRNFEAQEAGGYLAPILEQRPTLSRQVDAIQLEHGQLLQMAARISEDLSRARAEDRLLVADSSARIQRFMAVVAQHNQRENMITLFVFNQDIGSGE